MSLNKQTLIVAAVSMLSTTPSFAGTEISIRSIAGKTLAQIEKVLGKPTASTSVKPSRTPCPCDKLTYRNGQVEIVFMHDKSDWITINEVGGIAYAKEGLAAFGLPMASPSFIGTDSMRWENLQGLREVTFNRAGNKLSYVYVRTKTK
jgi:hypothetical protein